MDMQNELKGRKTRVRYIRDWPWCRHSNIKPKEIDSYGTGKEGKNEGDRRKTDSAEVRYE